MVLDNNQPLTSPGRFGTTDDITNIDFVHQDLVAKIGWKSESNIVLLTDPNMKYFLFKDNLKFY